MSPTSISHIFQKSRLGRRFTVITVMFLSVLLGILAYTITTIQHEKSNTLLIDVAGRQRMLIQRHINEIFWTSQGIKADYGATRELIRSTLHALIKSGDVVFDSESGVRHTVPAVPTEKIAMKLRDQQIYFEKLIQVADHFLSLSPDHPEYQQIFQNLRTQNSSLIEIADDAVKQLNAHSESNIATMLKWEILIALFVAMLGIFVTAQGIRVSKKLEHEMTTREQIQNKLKESQLFLDSIVENIPHMIFVKTAKDLRFVRFNKASEELLNCSRKDLVDKTDYDLFPKEQADFFTMKDREVLAGEKLIDVSDEPIQTKLNGVRHLHTKKIPLLDEHGSPQYLLGISEDITEQIQTEERLRESERKRMEALRQSDELKSALLSSVSHELRTPLTAMKASVSSIIGNVPSGMNDLQKEFLLGVDMEINYMSRLVDNLLDMSQIEAGTLIPHQEWHPLEDIVEGSLRRMNFTIENRNLKVEIPEDVPPVFVDAAEMQQVLTNLLDNAVKYSTPDSPIRIQVRAGVHQIEVKVCNLGEPIQEQELEQIFERFYRRRPPRKQPIRGTGLGLAICKKIVEAHGGKIWAESFEGEVKIIFTIPVKESMTSFSLEGLQKA